MLAEVGQGYVDASIGAFSTSLERSQLVEFSQTLVSTTLAVITKTPDKSLSVSYFTCKEIPCYVPESILLFHVTLAFVDSLWFSLMIFICILTLSFTIIFYLLSSCGIEFAIDKNGLIFATCMAINLSLRPFAKMSPDGNAKSVTYRIILFFTLICGYLTYAYYFSVFASTLITESKVLQYKSWDDVANSEKLLFVLKDSDHEDMFRYAPIDHPMRKIYDEKIRVVPPEKILNKIGASGTVPYIKNGEYLAFSDVKAYEKLKQYPCKITALESADEIKLVSKDLYRI